MDILTAPGGLLLGFVIAGILLPIAASIVLDGIVYLARGRGPKVLLIAGGITVVLAMVNYFAWQSGIAESETAAFDATDIDTMGGALELILLFSIPLALLAFAARMLVRYANPARRARENELAQDRKRHIASRKAHAHRGTA
jgi:hypothetical protein